MGVGGVMARPKNNRTRKNNIGPYIMDSKPKQETSTKYEAIKSAGLEDRLIGITQRCMFSGGSKQELLRQIGEDEYLGDFFQSKPKQETLAKWIRLYPKFRKAMELHRVSILMGGVSKLTELVSKAEEVGDIGSVIQALNFLDDGTINSKNRPEETIREQVAKAIKVEDAYGGGGSTLPDINIIMPSK